MRLELEKIRLEFNQYLREVNGNFHNTIFLLQMNEFLSQFPERIIANYRWIRRGPQIKPMLYLRDISRIISYNPQLDAYVVATPRNLDYYLE